MVAGGAGAGWEAAGAGVVMPGIPGISVDGGADWIEAGGVAAGGAAAGAGVVMPGISGICAWAGATRATTGCTSSNPNAAAAICKALQALLGFML